MPQAEIRFEILEDGTVKWETGRIPDEHHADADAFQVDIEKELGGPVQRTQKAAKPRHTHHHDHVYENERPHEH